MTGPETTLPDGSADREGGTDRDEAYCGACGQSFAPDVTTCPSDGARLIRLGGRRDDLLGRVFEGRYEVRAKLGAGGMGTVYRGWQLSVDREVAIKVIDMRLASDRVALKRFFREARLSSKLNHPSIIGVYDFGQTDDGILYIAMELLHGKTLAHELAGEAIAVRRAAGFVKQLCDALEHAHALGIVHRDLKPGNVMVLAGSRDTIKVLDFGLAKSLAGDGDARSQVTRTDAMLGTPLYMAPEQIDGKPSDQRADLYAVGCMFFEMLAGRPPFVDANMHAVLGKHLHDLPPPLPPAVPPSVSAIVGKLLAKEPDDRYGSAAEVRSALSTALDGAPTVDLRSIVVTPRGAVAATPGGLEATVDSGSAGGAQVEPGRGRRGVVTVAAVLAVAVFVAAGIFAIGMSQRGDGGDGSGKAITRDASAAATTPIDAALPPPVSDVAVLPPPPPPIDAAIADAAPPISDARRADSHHRPPPPPPPPRDAGDSHTQAPIDAAAPPRPIDAPDLNFVPSD